MNISKQWINSPITIQILSLKPINPNSAIASQPEYAFLTKDFHPIQLSDSELHFVEKEGEFPSNARFAEISQVNKNLQAIISINEPHDFLGFYVLHCVISYKLSPHTIDAFLLLQALFIFDNLSPLFSQAFDFICSNFSLNSEVDFTNILPIFHSFIEKHPNFQYSFIESLTNWLCVLVHSFDTPNTLKQSSIDFLFFLAQVIESHGQQLPHDLSISIIEIITSALSQLDPIVLNFFNHILPFIMSSISDPIFGLFPMGMINFIKKIKVFIPVPTDRLSAVKVPLPENLAPLQDILPYSTFTDVNFKIPEFKNQPILKTFKQICPRELSIIIDLISKLSVKADAAPICISSAAVTLLQNNLTDPHIIDFIFVFVSICRTFKDKLDLTDLFSIIFESSLFDQDIMLTEYNGVFFQVRAFVLMVYMECGMPECYLKSKICYPTFIDECFRSFRQMGDLDVFKTSYFILFLQEVLLNYQMADKPPYAGVIEDARLSIFGFISTILETPSNAVALHMNAHFVGTLFSHIWESSLTPYILSTFLRIWHEEEIDFDLFVAPQIAAAFKPSKVTDETVVTLTDVISTILKLFKFKPQTKSCFGPVIPAMLEFSRRLPQNQISVAYEWVMLDFLRQVATENFYTPQIRSGILTAIQSIEGDDPSEETFHCLTNNIAGQSLKYTTPTFNIVYADLPTLLMTAFLKAKLLPSVLSFFTGLCDFSTSNAIALHNGKLDLLILESIGQWRKEDGNESIIHDAMGVVTKIASVVSSTPVIQRFINLFCTIQNKYITKYHPTFMASMSKLVKSNNSHPIGSLLVTNTSPIIEITGLHLNHIANGFSMPMWFFIEKASINSSTVLMRFTDSKGHDLSLIKNGVEYDVVNNGKKISFKCPNLDSGWHLLCWTMAKKDQMAEVSINIGNKLLGPLTMPWPSLEKTTLSCQVGICQDVVSLRIGPFGLFQPLTLLEIAHIVSSGTRAKVNYNGPFFINFDVVHDLLVVQQLKPGSIKASLVGQPVIQHHSFSEVLIEFCKISVLIPLFAQLDLQSLNGEFELPPTSAIILISAFLLASREGQQNFAQSNGIQIIAYLLGQSDPRHLTSDVYESFYSLLQTLTDETLKQQLVDYILMSFPLWTRATGDVQMIVLTSWSKRLMADYKSLVLAHCSFTDILLAEREYYWYTNTDCLCKPRSHDDLNIPELRKALNQLLIAIATEKLTPRDFCMMASLCISTPDFQQVYDLLFLMKRLLKLPDSPLLKDEIKELFDKFLTFHHLLSVKDGGVCVRVLDLFALLHGTGSMTLTDLDTHVLILMDMIPVNLYNPQFFSRFMTIVAEYPQMIPLCFFRLPMADVETREFVMKSLRPDQRFAYCNTWSFWPIVSGIVLGDSYLDYVLDFICQSSLQYSKYAFAVITVVCRALRIDPEDAQANFIKKAISMVKNSIQEESIVQEIIELAAFFVFFRRTDYKNPALESQMSLFFGEPIEVPKTPNKFEKNLFFAHMQKMKKTPFRFGLRVNKSGKWLDLGLARTLTETTQNQTIIAVAEHFLNWTHQKDPNDDTPYEAFIRMISPFAEKEADLETTLSQTLISQQAEARIVKRDLFKRSDDKLFHAAQLLLAQIEKNESAETQTGRKLWNRLWAQLTFESAPWSSAVTTDTKVHYKRDNTLCFALCPMKMKINKNYDNHIYASLCRDTGSFTSAQSKLEEYKARLANEYAAKAPPKLLEIAPPSALAMKVEEKVETGEIYLEAPAVQIKVTGDKPCKFILTSTMIQLVYTQDNASHVRYIRANQVDRILFHPVLHQPTGIEIYTKNSRRAYLIKFNEYKSTKVLEMMSQMQWGQDVIQTLPPIQYLQSQGYTEKWINGEMSTFEYLMYLNVISGRTFNDAAAYPVFPWVLKDYESESIDLTNPDVYRNFEMPVGAFDKTRLDELVIRMKEMKQFGQPAFLYSAGYSSQLCIFLWLMRMEPFATLHIELQSGKFDHATRLFSSIANAFKMISTHMNDFRELPPEFFFSTEFLVNLNGYDLGNVDGRSVDQVLLPPWAKTPLEFVYMQRKALESDFTGEHIQKWIDLIWGVRQEGPLAVESHNLFNPEMYASAWNEENQKDPRWRAEIEAVMQHCGQIPVQLFNTEHLSRKPRSKSLFIDNPVDLNPINPMQIDYASFLSDALSVAISEHGTLSWLNITETNIEKFTIQQAPFDECTLTGLVALPKKQIAIADSLGYIRISTPSSPVTSLFAHFGRINALSADKTMIASGGTDTGTSVFPLEPPYQAIASVSSFRDEINCCAVSTRFALLVSATHDGSLFLMSTTQGEVVKVVDLEGREPHRILITPSWGFIVVHETRLNEGVIESTLAVFTKSGELVQRVKCDKIATWTSFASVDGFDYVAMTYENGRIFVFEAFRPEKKISIYKVIQNVIAIGASYATRDGAIISVIAKNGRSCLIPFYFSQLDSQ